MEFNKMISKLTVNGLESAKIALECLSWEKEFTFHREDSGKYWYTRGNKKSGELFDSLELCKEAAFLSWCNDKFYKVQYGE